jgi:geranylgeranyl diphosphate synthase type I
MLSVQQSTVAVDELDSSAALGALVGEAIEQRWPRGSSLLDRICRYALVPSGKLFRPVLLLESALAVGGSPRAVLPAAVGAECGHVASLIHDDIIDDDDLRRGRASVQHKFGIGDAIVAGDALIFDLFAGLAECHDRGVPDGQVVRALESVARAGVDLCRGQSLEAEICRNLTFDAGLYITMARLKTASFFRGACESGAILGGGPAAWVTALATYGDQLGIAFQIHDDLLTYTSSSAATGKPDISDVHNGRLTLPVILAYETACSADRNRIKAALTSCEDAVEALATLREVLSGTGAIASAVRIARGYAASARDALEVVPATASRDRLIWLAGQVINRDH